MKKFDKKIQVLKDLQRFFSYSTVKLSVEDLKESVAEKNTTIAEKDSLLAGKDALIQELTDRLARYEQNTEK